MIRFLEDPEEKARIAGSILAALPDWFGLPESTRRYIEDSRRLPFWAEFDGETPRGFLALKPTSEAAIEVYVMGVLLTLWEEWNPCQIYVMYIGG